MNKISVNISREFAMLVLVILCSLALPNQTFAQSVLSGRITNPTGSPLENVSVILSGDANDVTLTDANGDYQFQVDNGGTYFITPKNNNNPLNGVTSLDQILLDRHLQGIDTLDSPYKLLAADVNNDLVLDAFDVVVFTEMIFQIIPNFPNNTSWRYIDANQFFIDPTDPLSNTILDNIGLSSVSTDSSGLDFIGIKVGDLNFTADSILNPDPCNIGCAILSGKIEVDQNLDCLSNDNKAANSGWIIEAKSINDTFYMATNANGQYFIELTQGAYELTAFPKNNLWTFCDNNFMLTIDAGQEITQDFLTQAVDDCHLLSVDFGYSFLRRCFSTAGAINYCNDGTTTTSDIEITVTLDSLQSFDSSSIPWSTQNGSTYTFEIDSLEANTCGTIFVSIAVSCDAELNQTLCALTQITPFSDCFAPANWDGSDLTVDANCVDDKVEFTILNTGAPMTKSLEYIIIEDDMIMMIDNNGGILQTQETMEVPVSANGSTWRIEVNQADNHPFMEKVAVAIEGCGTDDNGEVSRGFINQFPLITNSKSSSINCSTVVGSFDPNDKTGFPRGAHDEHYIEKNTDIEYLIRFQNTGTDTAFTVVLRDTLSEYLDITSIVPGTGSHDYRFELKESNIIEFTFPEIMLPDSFVNEAASHGFVKFQIAQAVDNPIGTRIENSAGIYFDFNEPVITNTTFHTIGENFLDIVNHTISAGYKFFELSVAPNPTNNVAIVKVLGKTLVTSSLEMFDLNGRLVATVNNQEQQFIIHRNDLPAGMFFFKIIENGQTISSGKLLVTD